MIVQERQRILLETLLSDVPTLTWNQAFSLVDDLSRWKLISRQRRGFDDELRAPTKYAQALVLLRNNSRTSDT